MSTEPWYEGNNIITYKDVCNSLKACLKFKLNNEKILDEIIKEIVLINTDFGSYREYYAFLHTDYKKIITERYKYIIYKPPQLMLTEPWYEGTSITYKDVCASLKTCLKHKLENEKLLDEIIKEIVLITTDFGSYRGYYTFLHADYKHKITERYDYRTYKAPNK